MYHTELEVWCTITNGHFAVADLTCVKQEITQGYTNPRNATAKQSNYVKATTDLTTAGSETVHAQEIFSPLESPDDFL